MYVVVTDPGYVQRIEHPMVSMTLKVLQNVKPSTLSDYIFQVEAALTLEHALFSQASFPESTAKKCLEQGCELLIKQQYDFLRSHFDATFSAQDYPSTNLC